MNRQLTFRGRPVRLRNGIMLLERVADAPNRPVLEETVTIEGGSVVISTEHPAPASATRGKLVCSGPAGSREYPLPPTLLADMKAGSVSGWVLGTLDAVLGDLAEAVIDTWQFVFGNEHGDGEPSRPGKPDDRPDPDTPFVFIANPTLAAPTEGAELSYTLTDWIGDATIASTIAWRVATDVSGSAAKDVAVVDDICPAIDGAFTCIQLVETLIGPGIPGSSVTYSSAWRTITPTTETNPVSLVAAPYFAAFAIPVSDVSDPAEFAQGATVTGGTSAATATSLGLHGGMLYVGPVTGGPFVAEALTAGSGTATGDSPAAYVPTAGARIVYMPGEWEGDVSSLATAHLRAAEDDPDEADQTEYTPAGSTFPSDSAGEFHAVRERVTGYDVPADPGYLEASTGWVAIAAPELLPLADDQWFIYTPSEVNSTTVQMDIICVREDVAATADGARWSTGTQAYLAGVAYPTGREPTTQDDTRDVIELRYDAATSHGQFALATAVQGEASGAEAMILHWTSLTGTTGVFFFEAADGTFLDDERLILGTMEDDTFVALASPRANANGGSTTVVFRDLLTAPAMGGNPARDFRQFIIGTDDVRRARVTMTLERDGLYSDLSSSKTVPFLESEDPPIPEFDQIWFRHVNRTEGAFIAYLVYGDARQFPRSFSTSAARPGQVWFGVDITRPFRTKTFGSGEVFHSAPLYGMYANETTMGCLTGRWDADISLHYQSAGNLGNQGNFNSFAGVYRSDDDGETCELVLPLDSPAGSNRGDTRRLLHLLEWAPGGTSDDDSTVYCLHQVRPWATNTLGTGQLWRSDQGGKENTWVEDGSSFAASKFGTVYQIACKPNAETTGKKYDLYAAHDKGVSVRLNMAGTWTDCTGLPSGKAVQLEVRDGVVYAIVHRKGLYKATGTAFSLVLAGEWSQVGISNVKKNGHYRIFLCSDKANVHARWSDDTGASWTHTSGGKTVDNRITSIKGVGQNGSFEHNLWGNSSIFFIPHATDPDQCLVMRNQSMGKLILTEKDSDGNYTAVHASDGFDYSNINSICFNPLDAGEYMMCATDRMLIHTDNYGRWVHDGDVTKELKAQVKSILKTGNSNSEYNAYTSAGPLILTNNGHKRFLVNIGPGGGAESGAGSGRVPYIGSPKTSSPTKVNGSGVGALTGLSMPKGSKGGTYELRCTVANGNSSTWTLHGPRLMPNQLGPVLGTTTGTGAKTVAGVGFTIPTGTPTTSTRFSWYHNPIGTLTLMPGHADTGYSNPKFSETNPWHPERGCSGKNRLKMDASGNVSHDKGFGPQFQGYATASVIFGGDTTIQRSPNEGNSWSSWWSPPSNWDSLRRAFAAMHVSKHSGTRVLWANQAGEVYLVEAPDANTAPTATKIFDFLEIMAVKAPGKVFPGKMAGTGTPYRPPINAVTEDPWDKRIITVQVGVGGFPVSWRTEVGGGGAANWTDVSKGGSYCDARLHVNPGTGENLSTSRHGTGVLAVPAAHRALHDIDDSIVDVLVQVFGDEIAEIGM